MPLTADSVATADRAYVTYFNRAYLPQAKVLLTSLRGVGEAGVIVVVCFDDTSLAAMRTWPDPLVIAVPIADLEATYPALRSVRAQRSTAEYFFTCTPWVVLYAANLVSGARWITYLDADVALFAAPDGIYEELTQAHAAAGIVAHNYLPRRKSLERFGRYNVGWVTFAIDGRGRQLLAWWGEKCLHWCRDQPDEQGFADQGYLDSFAEVVEGVRVIKQPGAHLGPWNVGSHVLTPAPELSTQGPLGPGILVDGQPLVSFHFHGLRKFGDRFVAMHLPFGTRVDAVVGKGVYAPYVRALAGAETTFRMQSGQATITGSYSGRRRKSAGQKASRGRGWQGAVARARRRAFYSLARLRGESWSTTD